MGRFPTTLSLFLIILLHTNILIAYSQQLVLDTNGDFVQPGVAYIIQPLSASGTIGLSSAPNRTCPLDVVLQTDITKNASNIPVTFSPINSKDNFISIGTDTNIEFLASTICVTSTVWRIQPSSTNATTTTYFVTIGGVKGNPGRATLNNWFNIESSELGGYLINFCPNVCSTCRPVCGDIGLIPEKNGRTRLGIASPQLRVNFVKSIK